jgi:hypothetical protein
MHAMLFAYMILFRFFLALFFYGACSELSAQSFSVSPQYYYFDYEEFDTNDRSLNNETGRIPGIDIALAGPVYDAFSAVFTLSYSSHKVDYRGLTQFGREHTTGTKQRFIGMSALAKYDFILRSLVLSPLIEVQKRSWQRRILASNNVSYLNEDYRWLELAVGFDLSYPLGLGVLRGGLKKIASEYGSIKIDSPSLAPGRPTLDLGSGSGVSLIIAYQQNIFEGQSLTVEGFYKEWSFSRGKSKVVESRRGQSIITEPRSQTKLNGLRLIYSYHFR